MFKVKGVQAIKQHAFFKVFSRICIQEKGKRLLETHLSILFAMAQDIDWYLLAQKKIDPPITPSIQSSIDTSNFSEAFTKMAVGIGSRRESREQDAKLFARFSFNADLEHRRRPSKEDPVVSETTEKIPEETLSEKVNELTI